MVGFEVVWMRCVPNYIGCAAVAMQIIAFVYPTDTMDIGTNAGKTRHGIDFTTHCPYTRAARLYDCSIDHKHFGHSLVASHVAESNVERGNNALLTIKLFFESTLTTTRG